MVAAEMAAVRAGVELARALEARLALVRLAGLLLPRHWALVARATAPIQVGGCKGACPRAGY